MRLSEESRIRSLSARFNSEKPGAFSDITGTYARGDMQDLDDSVEHQPHALPGEDCICLVVTDHPLKFKSRAAQLVQPLLGI